MDEQLNFCTPHWQPLSTKAKLKDVSLKSFKISALNSMKKVTLKRRHFKFYCVENTPYNVSTYLVKKET